MFVGVEKVSGVVFSEVVERLNPLETREFLLTKKRLDKYFAEVKELKKQGFVAAEIDKIEETEKRVAYIFEKVPSTKGSEKELVIRFWSRFSAAKLRRLPDNSYVLRFPNYQQIFELPTTERIVRAARRWREHGFYLPSPETEAVRHEEEKAYHTHYSGRVQLDLGEYL